MCIQHKIINYKLRIEPMYDCSFGNWYPLILLSRIVNMYHLGECNRIFVCQLAQIDLLLKNWLRIDRTGMISLVRLICHCKWCQHKRRVKKEIFQSCHYWTLSIQSYVLNMCAALEHTFINNGCIFKRFCNFWMIVLRGM